MKRKIVIYTTPNCMQCQFTKKYLDENHIPYEIRDVSAKEEYRREVLELGFQAVPVVLIDGQEPFYGFRPEKLATLVKE